MVARDVLKVFQIALAYSSCNFGNFQNITCAHKSRNALPFMRFPILTLYSTMEGFGFIKSFSSSFTRWCEHLGLIIAFVMTISTSGCLKGTARWNLEEPHRDCICQNLSTTEADHCRRLPATGCHCCRDWRWCERLTSFEESRHRFVRASFRDFFLVCSCGVFMGWHHTLFDSFSHSLQ